MATQKAQKKTASVSPECVACGCCVKACPLGAISIEKGIRAVVNSAKCVGCGKCRDICPAGVITLRAVAEKEGGRAV